MKPDTKTAFQKQSDSDWPVVVVRPSTRAGCLIARRYGVTASIADVIAEAAGLGEVRA